MSGNSLLVKVNFVWLDIWTLLEWRLELYLTCSAWFFLYPVVLSFFIFDSFFSFGFYIHHSGPPPLTHCQQLFQPMALVWTQKEEEEGTLKPPPFSCETLVSHPNIKETKSNHRGHGRCRCRIVGHQSPQSMWRNGYFIEEFLWLG